MNYIPKIAPPQELIDWITSKKELGETPKYQDNTLPKVELKKALLAEQKHLCCYCQQKISLKNSTIEHFLPESKFKNHVVDYFNLHLVCNYSRNVKKEHSYCDVSKANDLIINVLSHPDCEDFFKYNPLGEILPNDSKYREYKDYLSNAEKLTLKSQSILHLISVLNLNHSSLVGSRKKQLNDIIPEIKTKSKDELENYLNNENLKTNKNRFFAMTLFFGRDKLKRL